MSKILSGAELAGYIKERQARQVRALRQAHQVFPKLAIIKSLGVSSVIDTYIKMKQEYADDILIETEVFELSEDEMISQIARLNSDDAVQGMIVQLPLADKSRTDEIVNLIAPAKDVDGLGLKSQFISATAEAIDWLLTGYDINLAGKAVTIVGNGRLVGAPLVKLWQSNGHEVVVLDEFSENITATLRKSDVIVSATGVSGLIKSQDIRPGTVVIDAGTTSESGKIKGDVSADVYARNDLIITPKKGGVGPLTIALLFDHLITAARASIKD